MTRAIWSTVLFPPGKLFPNKFKEGTFQQNAKFETDDGEQVSKWFAQGLEPWASLTKGERIHLLVDQGKVVGMVDEEPSATRASATQSSTGAAKRLIGRAPQAQTAPPRQYETITEHDVDVEALFLATIIEKLLTEMGRKQISLEFSAEDYRTMATSIYIKLNQRGGKFEVPETKLDTADVPFEVDEDEF